MFLISTTLLCLKMGNSSSVDTPAKAPAKEPVKAPAKPSEPTLLVKTQDGEQELPENTIFIGPDGKLRQVVRAQIEVISRKTHLVDMPLWGIIYCGVKYHVDQIFVYHVDQIFVYRDKFFVGVMTHMGPRACRVGEVYYDLYFEEQTA